MAQPQTPKTQIIIIDAEGDLTIRLYETLKNGATFIGATGKMTSGHILATFKVKRQLLVDNSSQFGTMLSGGFAESRQSVIDIKEGTVASLELWFRVLHDKMTDDMYVIANKDVWEAIEICGYRDFDIEKLKGWFAKWWEKKDLMVMGLDEMRQLLFPCHEFDHARGFAFLSRKLTYGMADHITEHNPTVHNHLHLEGNVIGSINGARGSLRSKLLRGLFDPVGQFLNQTCSCKEKSLFAYCTGLSKTGIWPLESHHRKSVREILESPGFKKFDCKIPENACAVCSYKIIPSAIKTTLDKVATDFHGLCLDCMDKTKPKFGDVDKYYWRHDEDRCWGSGCRIQHGQPTWYFSFIGRKADMKAHQLRMKKKRAMRRSYYYSDSDY